MSQSVSRLASLAHALRGLRVFVSQPNARIHLASAVAVVLLGYGFNVSHGEWLALLLAIGLVLTAEALNTALELVVDRASPEWHPLARDAKDVAAAAVLMASMCAAVVGLVVFVPRL